MTTVWSDMGDGTWRKERWVAFPFLGKWRMNHDDFAVPIEGQCLAFQGNPDPCGNIACSTAQDQLTDFLTWHAANTFTPLPIPEVGQWGRFELRDGRVVEGEVTSVYSCAWHEMVYLESKVTWLNTSVYAIEDPYDILAWSPIDPPQPAEPTGLGAVVEVGGKFYVRTNLSSEHPWLDISTGKHSKWGPPPNGPVTVKAPGVDIMPRFIMKDRPDADWYVMWSTIVDAPVFAGTRAEFWTEFGAEGAACERFERADATGTSLIDGEVGGWDDESILVANLPEGGPDEGNIARRDLRAFVEAIAGGRNAEALAFVQAFPDEDVTS